MGQLDEAADIHLQIAELYVKQKIPGKAITQRERAVSLRPDLTGVRVEIARAYGQAGNTKKAVQTLLALATYYGQTGDRELALITVQEALRINPQHPKALEMIKTLS
jgi:Tfp pilus assembly protein PilF